MKYLLNFSKVFVVLLLFYLNGLCQTIRNDNLYNEIVAIRNAIPDENSNAFVQPTTEQMQSFKTLMELIVAGEYSRADTQAAALNYILYEWYDTGNENHQYYVLMEPNADQVGGVQLGWGTFIMDPVGIPEVIIEVPHPLFDTDTWKLGFLSYQHLNSRFFLMAGTHRYANGRTPPIADVPHGTQNMFHVVHQVVAPYNNHALQVHGFSISNHPGYPNGVLSNGTSNPSPTVNTIAAAIISRGYTIGVYDGINWGELGATSNTQGQWSRSHGYSFIHMELEYFIRTTQSDWENIIYALDESFTSPKPVITNIADIPDDQGGWVLVNFKRSFYDTTGLHSESQSTLSTSVYTIEMNDGTGWTAVNSTGAYGKENYSILARTTVDSSEGTAGLLSFRVIAGMENGNFVSDIVQGYSVDNIAPAVPTGLLASRIEENTVRLTWNQPIDEDFSYFKVYRSLETDFNPTELEPIAQTSENIFIDNVVGNYYYRVLCVDVHGNEGNYSRAVSVDGVTSSPGEISKLPEEFALAQNYPNPFNPSTTFAFNITVSGNVRLKIFDILGNEIRTLVSEEMSAGRHEKLWNGTDNSNQPVASGVYLASLETTEGTRIIKLQLLK